MRTVRITTVSLSDRENLEQTLYSTKKVIANAYVFGDSSFAFECSDTNSYAEFASRFKKVGKEKKRINSNKSPKQIVY